MSDQDNKASDTAYGSVSDETGAPDRQYFEGDGRKRHVNWCTAKRAIISSLFLVAIAVGIVVAVSETEASNSPSSPTDLASALSMDAVKATLRSLEQCAEASQEAAGHPTRSINFAGFNATVDFITSELSNTDFQVRKQFFEFSSSVTLSAGMRVLDDQGSVVEDYIYQSDFGTFRLQGSGNVTAQATALSGDGDGCSSEQFDGVAGKIAIIRRSKSGAVNSCTFAVKVQNAIDANAKGAIIYNDPEDACSGLIRGSIGFVAPFPVFSTDTALGQTLSLLNPVYSIQMTSTAFEETVIVTNILADSVTGSGESVVISGSHMDSVDAGPGINDNGSGSSANLEMALQLAKLEKKTPLVNKVRFAWWGAEEVGLVGSRHYVTQLSAADKATIALNLNFDMLGSPNYFFGIHNGSSGFNLTGHCERGSVVVQEALELAFKEAKQPYQLTPFTGRSDYGPFIEVGIPAGGLATGAEGIKGLAERKLFGGVAQTAFDPCYHQACDTFENVNLPALEVSARAAASALSFFMKKKDLIEYLDAGKGPLPSRTISSGVSGGNDRPVGMVDLGVSVGGPQE